MKKFLPLILALSIGLTGMLYAEETAPAAGAAVTTSAPVKAAKVKKSKKHHKKHAKKHAKPAAAATEAK